MTLDEAMAKATAALDEVYAEALRSAASMADASGATTEEYATFLHWQTEMLAADRDKKLADLRAWLSRGGKTAH